MNLNRYTEKAQEAVIEAKQLAEEFSHQEVTPDHLVLALVEQEGGVVPRLLKLMQLQPDSIATPVRATLAKAPKLSGHQQITCPAPSTSSRPSPSRRPSA